MTHLTVPEWGRVPVGPQGFTAVQAETLMIAARAHPLGGEDGSAILADHRHYLRARQMVGVLAAPGCSLEILPKVDPEAPDEHSPTVRRRLIALLDLALGLDLGNGANAAMTRGAENLLEILIRIFAERLLTETRRGCHVSILLMRMICQPCGAGSMSCASSPITPSGPTALPAATISYRTIYRSCGS